MHWGVAWIVARGRGERDRRIGAPRLQLSYYAWNSNLFRTVRRRRCPFRKFLLPLSWKRTYITLQSVHATIHSLKAGISPSFDTPPIPDRWQVTNREGGRIEVRPVLISRSQDGLGDREGSGRKLGRILFQRKKVPGGFVLVPDA